MTKIDEAKLQMYVDGELDPSENKIVEEYIKNNNEAKDLVNSYKKINHLIFSTYNQIRSEDLPKKTLDLLLDEKPSFINQLLNYKIKLAPALGALAAIILVISISFNSNKIINNTTDPIHLMSEKNKNIVLAQLEDILQKDKNNLNGFISLSNTNIEYTESKSYVDKFGRNCKDITFDNFVIKDLIINSATFVKLDDGSWKVIKLEFEKNNSLGI